MSTEGTTSLAAAEPPSASPRGLSRRLRVEFDLGFLIGALVLLIVVMSLASPFFLTSRNIQELLFQTSVLAIVSFGVTVVIISGNFDLSVGAGVGLVGIVVAEIALKSGSLVVGLLCGLGVGLAIGLINGIASTALAIPSFIVTLAMLVICRGLALTITHGQTAFGFPGGLSDFIGSDFLGLKVAVWIALIVLVSVHCLMRYTRLGIQIYAVGGNAAAARVSGLPVKRIQTAAFVVSGLCVAVAAVVLLGRVDAAQPTAGMNLELFGVAAVVIGGASLYGGRGSVLRTALGVLLIAILQNGLTLQGVSTDLANVILGVVLMIAASSGVWRARRSR